MISVKPVIDPISVGRVPVKVFIAISKIDTPVNSPISVGMVPEKALFPIL